jgi:DNA-binding transcriptional ArsR family regulator
MTDLRHSRPLSQVEIEDRIQAVIQRMEDDTEEYDDIAKAAAEAEADYRRAAAMAKLAVIQHGEKMTVGERDAKVDVMTADAHKAHLITTAARNSKREHLQTLRAHLDALRTLNASVRGQT